MKYAQIENGTVVGLYPIMQVFEVIECPDEVQLGWIYDGEGFAISEAPERKTWPDGEKFLREFNFNEIAAIATSQNPIISAIRMLITARKGEVWSDDPEIIDGMNLLIQDGIISQQRADEILLY